MKKLHNLLTEERAKLIESTLKDGAVDKESLERLERLSKFEADVGDRRRWLVWLALALGVIFAATLYFRRSETDIDLNVTVSEFAFTPKAQTRLVSRQSVTNLSADGIQFLEFESGERLSAPEGTGGCFLMMQLPTKSAAPASLTLAPFRAPEATRVRLGRNGSGIHWRFAPVDPKKTALPTDPIELTVVGAVGLDAACGTESRKVSLQGAGSVVRAYVLPSFSISYVAEKPKFEREIALEQLTISERRDAMAGVATEISGLLGGTIYLNDLEARKLELRSSEHLAFKGSRGELRSLSVDPDSEGLKLDVHVVVTEMTTGSGDTKRPRMPNYLEWIYAREWFRYIGGGVTLFGTLYAVLKWLKFVS